MAGLSSYKSLKRTFDPPPIFAVAKTVVAIKATEFGLHPESD